MKVKMNVSPLQVVGGVEIIKIGCVFDGLTVRKYEPKDCWFIYCPFWWEHLFNEKFDTAEEAIKFVEMRCEEYINEVLEWVVLDETTQEKQ